MAEFFLRNSLNPYKVIKIGITFSNVVNKGDDTGDVVWVVEVATNEPHKEGGTIPPAYIHLITLEDFDQEVEKAVVILANQVDWTPLDVDDKAPYIYSYSPTTEYTPIDTPFEASIREFLPFSGIDISSITCTINGFDVTDELVIKGNPYQYDVYWMPKDLIRDTYE